MSVAQVYGKVDAQVDEQLPVDQFVHASLPSETKQIILFLLIIMLLKSYVSSKFNLMCFSS